jgi:glutathione S-transferase
MQLRTGLTIAFIERGIAGTGYLVGNGLTGADIQMFYMIDFATSMGLICDQPKLLDYHKRLSERAPGFPSRYRKGRSCLLATPQFGGALTVMTRPRPS